MHFRGIFDEFDLTCMSDSLAENEEVQIEVDSDGSEFSDDEGDLQSGEESSDDLQSEDEGASNDEDNLMVFEAFSSLPKHMRCIAHALQLVLKDAFEKNQEMADLKKVNINLIRI